VIRLRGGVTLTEAEIAELAVFLPMLHSRLDELEDVPEPMEATA
jgi:hypothetical protein